MPEHTIAENLTRLQNAKTAIGSAITAKGGTVGANDGLEEFAADIATIPSGGGSSKNDVNFYDYDGTIVQSYSAADFANLSELPANPSHEGLTAQGWNWSLSDAKNYVAANGKIDIGQMYVTDDGKTRLHIRLGEGRLKPFLGLTGNNNGTTVSIDWGDGSTSESVSLDANTVYTPHEYASHGDYTISITVDTGSITLTGNNSTFSNMLRKSSTPNGNNDGAYQNSLISIEIGNNVSIGQSAFINCYSLTSITIPNSVTSIGTYAFSTCYSLTSITIPNRVTSIGASTFSTCYSLQSITIPNSVTSIGTYAFSTCYSLTSITIPNRVTSIITYLFNNCYSLQSITIPNSVTSIGQSAFQYCYSLTSITIPNSVTSIGQSAFINCYSLTSITIPNSVTSIGQSAFSTCYSLTSITIPNSVTSIGQSAFINCYGLGSIKFSSTIPPGVSSSNAWMNVQSDCTILAPALVVNLYMDKTSYPSKSTYTYLGYATYETGETLPSTTTDETYTLTWYATQTDAIAQTNPITQGTGSEVYARATAI